MLTMDEPIIDLRSDAHFMGAALRLAVRAYAAEEVPIGAVIVREGRIIGRAFNQVVLLTPPRIPRCSRSRRRRKPWTTGVTALNHAVVQSAKMASMARDVLWMSTSGQCL